MVAYCNSTDAKNNNDRKSVTDLSYMLLDIWSDGNQKP